MPKLNQEFYSRASVEVAKGILGRYLVYPMPNEALRLQLTEIAAYEGASKKTSIGASYAPGLISISSKFGKLLLDIATGKPLQPSCVTIRGVTLDEKLLDGPSAVTEALGITKHNKALFDAQQIYGDKIWIEGDGVGQSQIRKLNGNSPNCKGIFRLI